MFQVPNLCQFRLLISFAIHGRVFHPCDQQCPKPRKMARWWCPCLCFIQLMSFSGCGVWEAWVPESLSPGPSLPLVHSWCPLDGHRDVEHKQWCVSEQCSSSGISFGIGDSWRARTTGQWETQTLTSQPWKAQPENSGAQDREFGHQAGHFRETAPGAAAQQLRRCRDGWRWDVKPGVINPQGYSEDHVKIVIYHCSFWHSFLTYILHTYIRTYTYVRTYVHYTYIRTYLPTYLDT